MVCRSAPPTIALPCFIYLVLGGANPECAMTVASGPEMGMGYAIGGVPSPAERAPCPPTFLGRWKNFVVSTVPAGTHIEVHGAPCRD
jgi:hypothetical protein